MSEQVWHDDEEMAGEISVRRLIGVGLLTRLLVDTSVQIFFPFLSLIAQGVGTTEQVIGRLVSLRSATGLITPLFGALADRKGYRLVMRVGLLLAAVGYLLIGLSGSTAVLAAGMVVAGVGTFAFTPTLQAYLSNRLPYHRRARGLGVLEYAWALAGIVGLFLMGQLIAVTSWRMPFFVFAGGLFGAAVLYGYLPGVEKRQKRAKLVVSGTAVRQFFVLGDGRAYYVILSGLLLMFAGVNLFITYGTWLGKEYGLTAGGLGTVALVLGVSDLLGSVAVSVAGDGLGKRRSVILGAGLGLLFFALLPWLNVGLVAAVGGIFLARGSFEFAVVSNMTLLSEQLPMQRAKALTLGASGALVGSTTAGLTGPWVYDHWGVGGVAAFSCVAMGLVVVVNGLWVREPGG